MRILTVNVGSTNVKAAVFQADRWGVTEEGRYRLAAGELPEVDAPDVVAHRVVHGGPDFSAPVRIDDRVLAGLRDVVAFDPLHMTPQVAMIEAAAGRFPGVPQVACFDTAFHRTTPEASRVVPLPSRLLGRGVRGYGFHGLSFESILGRLRGGDPAAADEGLVIAHLGGGSSMAAVKGGRCVETTMGFTPTSGLVMGTRPGDLDPGLLLHVMRKNRLGPDEMERVLYHESGLTALGGTGDVAELLRREAAGDADAALALEVFVRRAARSVASLAVALGGLRTLVFTGGIGENSPEIRARIVAPLAFLGVTIDPVRGAAGGPVVSPDGAAVSVRVMHTDEESVIARHAATLITTELRT